ncbi:hypothetical protein C8F04DRAFT_1177057 [Mycena alexandri]|uniref:Uncharacterized protein n=1 Tax=Mycena alexandri TaxID=1745969 RepID=A0AAD6X9G7_9AGAR|nr:hypothetical protein C8F04DRAFT_1177057 [Mycena alexandri]
MEMGRGTQRIRSMETAADTSDFGGVDAPSEIRNFGLSFGITGTSRFGSDFHSPETQAKTIRSHFNLAEIYLMHFRSVKIYGNKLFLLGFPRYQRPFPRRGYAVFPVVIVAGRRTRGGLWVRDKETVRIVSKSVIQTEKNIRVANGLHGSRVTRKPATRPVPASAGTGTGQRASTRGRPVAITSSPTHFHGAETGAVAEMFRKALPDCIQDASRKPPILSPGPRNNRERAPTADAGHYYTDSHSADWGRSLADCERPTLDDRRLHNDRFSLKEYDDPRPYAADAHPRMDLTQLVPKQPVKRVRADDDEAAGPSNKRQHLSESHGQGAEAVQHQTEDLGEDNAQGSKRPREESDEAEVLLWPQRGPYRLQFYIKKSQDEMLADPDDQKRWRMSTDFYASHFVAKLHPTTADDHTFAVDLNNPDTGYACPRM